ncbi:MAG TPA: hypothetical protein VK846_14515 [Candidatus Limnocylindria bacterium]|nr:hypothetical protein [Candidatus Limnocylindria bacterium]
MTETITSPFAWWSKRRLSYNLGLVCAGILSFVAYAVVGWTLVPEYADFEITLFTTLFQGVGYLFMIGIANIFYFLGPLSERVVHPENPERYRRICFRLGFWFSVLLPFGIPVLLAMSAVFYPEHWRHVTDR